MTDIVAIAVMRRQALCAEVETLDRFIGTAEWLLRGRGGNARAESTGRSAATPAGENRRPTAPAARPATDNGRAAEAGEKPAQAQANDRSRAGTMETALAGEWELDTFHFEAAATAS